MIATHGGLALLPCADDREHPTAGADQDTTSSSAKKERPDWLHESDRSIEKVGRVSFRPADNRDRGKNVPHTCVQDHFCAFDRGLGRLKVRLWSRVWSVANWIKAVTHLGWFLLGDRRSREIGWFDTHVRELLLSQRRSFFAWYL